MGRVILVAFLGLASVYAGEGDNGDQPQSTDQAPQAEDREAPPMDAQKVKPEPAKPEAEAKPKAERKATPKAAAPKAEAQPEAKPEAKPEEAKPASPPTQDAPKITTHAYDQESTGALADAVENAINEELGADARLKYIDKRDILTPPGEIPRLLGEADLEAVDGDEALSKGDVDKARGLLEKALKTYLQYLPQLAARGGGLDPFRDAWIKLANARFFDGDQKGARDALRYVFVVDPNIKWDPKLFPAAMKKVVVESRLLFDTLGPGTLNIDSDPPGATVYLNGKKLDKITPIEGVPAPPGPNYLSFVRRDWQPQTAIFEVAGGGESASAVRSLEHYPGRPLQALNRAQKELDNAEASPLLKEGANKLGVDMLVLVRLEKAEGFATRLSGYLYDKRLNKILKRSEKTAPDDAIAPAAKELGRELVTGVRLDGKLDLPVVKKGPSASEKIAQKFRDFRNWKGFWYVVGGVAGAIVIATAVGVGVGVGTQNHGLTPGEQIVLIGGH